MKHRPIEFTVWQSGKDRRFYVHMTHGNGKVTMAEPKGRARASGAFSLCNSIWLGIGHSIDPQQKLRWPPTPYAKGSLQPHPPAS